MCKTTKDSKLAGRGKQKIWLKTKFGGKYAGVKGFAGPQPGTAIQVIFMHRKDLDHWILVERAPY